MASMPSSRFAQNSRCQNHRTDDVQGDVQILRALKAGAQGYLLKNTIHKELTETVRAVHAGKKALSPEARSRSAEHATDDALTPAEINVLRLIAAGNANK